MRARLRLLCLLTIVAAPALVRSRPDARSRSLGASPTGVPARSGTGTSWHVTVQARKRSIVALLLLPLLVSCSPFGAKEPRFDTPYQAVHLANGQVFFGRLSNPGSDYPRLDDVFYVQTQVNPDTRQATSVLIRRGKEWHGPAYMVVNARSILIVEPVSADSKVAQLIAEALKQGG